MDKCRKDVLAFKELVKGGVFFCFDTETTGLSPVDDDIIEFSAVRYEDRDGQYIETDALDIFINPGRSIPEEITRITGITNQQIAKEGVSPEEAARRIYEFMGDAPVVIGYNSLSFDQNFMNSLYRKTLGSEFKPSFHLDVIKMAREKFQGSHKLVCMAEKAGIADRFRFHSSLDDARATFEVFKYILPLYDKAEPPTDTAAVKITGFKRWQKSDTLDRLYVGNTKNISMYLDIPKNEWNIAANVETADVVGNIYSFAGVASNAELLEKYG